MITLASKEHFLYRCFDANGALLYIGVTSDLRERFNKHRVVPACAAEYPAAQVFSRMAFWTAERFPNRRSVLDAEGVAIRTELPELNLQHRSAS